MGVAFFVGQQRHASMPNFNYSQLRHDSPRQSGVSSEKYTLIVNRFVVLHQQ